MSWFIIEYYIIFSLCISFSFLFHGDNFVLFYIQNKILCFFFYYYFKIEKSNNTAEYIYFSNVNSVVRGRM